MSTTGQPKFPCDKCGHAQVDVILATICHITDIDPETQVKSTRREWNHLPTEMPAVSARVFSERASGLRPATNCSDTHNRPLVKSAETSTSFGMERG